MKNARILSIILAVALVLPLLPAFGTTAAFADGQDNNYTVSYADANTASVGVNYVNPVGFTDQGNDFAFLNMEADTLEDMIGSEAFFNVIKFNE